MNLDNLSKSDIDAIRKAIVKCSELKQMIARGVSCGMECQEISQRCAQAEQFLSQVNQIYGPQFPAKSS